MALSAAHAEVTAERSERGAVVKIDGKPFTEYLTKAGQSPALWPIIGPTGQPMTRSYPLRPAEKDGTKDHPHHQSLWFIHDEVNGVGFWRANVNEDDKNYQGPNGPRIVHRDFVKIESGPTARIVTRDDWTDGDKRICEDERTIVFGQGVADDHDARFIDFTVTVKAPDGDVTFADTKEGTFAVRVADSMRVDAKTGGHIVNSEGQENAHAWGMPARWVDYTGPIDGESVGVAILSHPKSFRPTPRWHVRTYGLFAANPFGEKDFPRLPTGESALKQGAVTIKRGDTLKFRYLVIFHRGETNADELNRAFDWFATN